MNPIVTKLRAYRMTDDEGNEEILSPVTPAPKRPPVRMVPMTQAEAEALEFLGQGLVRLGADRTGLLCLRLAASWELGA